MQQNRPTSATYTILAEKKDQYLVLGKAKNEAFCLVINSQADCFSGLSGSK